VQFTLYAELGGKAVEVSEVPGVEGKVSVAALIVHEAVIVIETVKFAVAVPANTFTGRPKHAVRRARVGIIARAVLVIFTCWSFHHEEARASQRQCSLAWCPAEDKVRVPTIP